MYIVWAFSSNKFDLNFLTFHEFYKIPKKAQFSQIMKSCLPPTAQKTPFEPFDFLEPGIREPQKKLTFVDLHSSALPMW